MVDGTSKANGTHTHGTHPVPWVAFDAMGADLGPAVCVAGALEGVRRHGVNTVLVGDEKLLTAEVTRQGGGDLLGRHLRVVHAPDVVTMADKAAEAVRKKGTSMRRAYELVNAGEAVAAVSAGNSGAYMGLALVLYGRIRGVLRPAIGTLMPGPLGNTLLLDSGANTVVTPSYLMQWAFMGDAYARTMQGKQRPRVAVLSNGEEDGKGTDLTRAANAALKAAAGSALNYVGYCEGRDIPTSEVDVVITDGFTGNVVLKLMEGVGRGLRDGLEARFRRDLVSKLQYLVVANLLQEFRQRVDYRLTGGAPLLGVNGVAIVSHGRSDGVALGHALRVAAEHVRLKVNDSMGQSIAQFNGLFPDAKEKARQYSVEHGLSAAEAG